MLRISKQWVIGVITASLLVTIYSSDTLMIRLPSETVERYVQKTSSTFRRKGLLAYWDFDGRTIEEYVRYGACVAEGVMVTDGVFGNARHFDPENNGVVSTSFRWADAGEAVTLTGWVKILDKSRNQRLCYYLRVEDGQLLFHLPNELEGLRCEVPEGEDFFHLAAVMDPDAQEARLYVNGKCMGVRAMPEPARLVRRGSVVFGQELRAPPPDFILDEFAVWDHALGASDVKREAETGKSLLLRLAGHQAGKLALARAWEGAAMKLMLAVDLFNPFVNEGAFRRAGVPVCRMDLSRQDIKTFNRYVKRTVMNGWNAQGSSEKRKGTVRWGGEKRMNIEVFSEEHESGRPIGRNSYRCEPVDASPDSDSGRIVLRPSEESGVIPLLASRLAGEWSVPAVPVKMCTLHINGVMKGLYTLYDRSSSPGRYWLDQTEECLRLLSDLPMETKDILSAYDELAKTYTRMVQRDWQAPFPARSVRYMLLAQRGELEERLKSSNARSKPNVAEDLAAFVGEKLILGDNPCPELIVTNLVFPDAIPGGEVSVSSLTPGLIGPEGEVMRPLSGTAVTGRIEIAVSANEHKAKRQFEFLIQPRRLAIPILQLCIAEPLQHERKRRVACAVQHLDTDGTTTWKTGAIRYRGNSSLYKAEKKYISLRIDDPHHVIKDRTCRYVNLTSSYRDHTFMRDKLAYDLFRAFGDGKGKNYAPSYNFAEVSLNGEYMGIYGISERVDAAALGFDTTNSPVDIRPVLYKGLGSAANFETLAHYAYVRKVPHWREDEYWGPYEQLINFTGKSTDATFAREAEARIDVANIIDYQILINVANTRDGVNYSLFIARGGEPDAKFFLIPWDFDEAFRNSDTLQNYLMRRLSQTVPDYEKRLRLRYHELRRGVLSNEAVLTRMRDIQQTLEPCFGREFKRWPTRDHADNVQDIDTLREWLIERLANLDERWAVNVENNDK